MADGRQSKGHGEFPEDWALRPLGDFADFRNGLNFLQGDHGYDIKVVGVADFQDKTHLTYDGLGAASLSRPVTDEELLKDGDLVLVRSNGNKKLIGRCLLVRGIDEPISHSGFTIRARLNDPGILPEYVNLHARSFFTRRQIHIAGGGTNISNLSQGILSRLLVPVAPALEQEEIVRICAAWDAAVDQTTQLTGAKEKLRKALVQQLLTGKRRFPEFGKSGSRGRLPEGWQLLRASSIFTRRSERGHGSEPVLSATQDMGVVRRDSLDRKINMNASNTDTYKLVAPGDFIISLRSFQGGVEYCGTRGLVSPAYHVIRPVVPICPEFYRHYFKSYEFIGRLAVAVIGIRDGKQISYEDFEFMRFPYPPLEEQRKIAGCLDACERELALLRREAEALQRQKRGLMQKLLTGQVRVRGTCHGSR